MKAVKGLSFLLAMLMLLVCVSGCGSDESKPTKMPAVSSTTTVVTENSTTVPSSETTVTEAPTTSVTEPSDSVSTAAATTTTSLSAADRKTTTVTKAKPSSTTVKPTPTTTAPTKPKPPAKPVTLTALPSTAYYGYRHLTQTVSASDKYVAAYQRVVDGIETMAESIVLEDVGITDQQLKVVMRCYHADYPHHFWYNGAYSYVTNSSGTVLSVKPTYTMTAQQQQAAQPKMEAAVQELLKKAAYGQTEYERELILHDELAVRVKYTEGANAHNMYGALVEGKAVCEGYARAFQYLLYRAGIECLFVEGTSVRPGGTKGEAHAWNVVKIGGKYYHTDVTWDDQSGAAVSVMHAFFNSTDALINEGHTVSADNPYPIPTCNATADSYFVREGTEMATFSVDKVVELFTKGNGTATVYVSQKSVNEFIAWFQDNISAISTKAKLAGKTFSLQYCGREVVIITK